MPKGDGEYHVQDYLTYLDKEMTIMGILSAIPVAVVAASFKALSGTIATQVSYVICHAPASIVLIHVMLIFAALSFYRQRSKLAWYYGQISLQISGYDTGTSVFEWLENADAWDTWIDYQRAFWLLVGCGAESVIAAIFCIQRTPLLGTEAKVSCIVAVVLVIWLVIHGYILEKYRLAEEPYVAFRKSFTKQNRIRKSTS